MKKIYNLEARSNSGKLKRARLSILFKFLENKKQAINQVYHVNENVAGTD